MVVPANDHDGPPSAIAGRTATGIRGVMSQVSLQGWLMGDRGCKAGATAFASESVAGVPGQSHAATAKAANRPERKDGNTGAQLRRARRYFRLERVTKSLLQRHFEK